MSDDRRLAERGPDRRRWLGLAVLSLGVSMIIVDATIVNVALPSIIGEFDLGLNDAEWVNSIYSLVFAALLITLGKVGDAYGRRRLFIIGLVVFAGASMLAGRAGGGTELIMARVLQGVGAGVILPSTLSTVNATFQGRDRGIAFGIWGSVIGGMAAVGPLLGGWLTTEHSWRWAFYINVPIAVMAVIGSFLWVKETRQPRTERGFDVGGVFLSGLGMAGVVFALIEGPRFGFVTPTEPFTVGGFDWPLESISPSIVAFVAGALLLVAFVFSQRRRTRDNKAVLFDLSLFRFPSFSIGNATAMILALGEFGLIFVLPLFLQAVLAFSAFETGLLLMSLAIGAFVAGPTAGAIASRIGPRRVVSTGMALEALAIAGVALLLAPGRNGWAFVPGLFVYGVGVGLASAQLTSVILAEIPSRESGQASGMQSTFRQVGAAVGIALLGTVLAATLRAGTEDALAAVPDLPPQAQAGIVDAISGSAGQALPALAERPGSEPVVAAVGEAFADAATTTGLVAVAFVLAGLVLSLRLPDIRYADRPIEEPAATGVGSLRVMNTNPEVDAWFDAYEHPAKDAMLRVREIILGDERMTETIKWKSPTFMYEGNMASFNPRTKAHVSLMFHTGASIPGDHPRLEGGGETARYMKFADLADVEASSEELRAVVAAWCDSRG